MPILYDYTMKFSLIIPAWNEAAFLPDTLDVALKALREIEALGEHVGELIVVDNNSTDETASIASDLGVKVVFEPINQIARARNRGASVAMGEALIFLDADSQCSVELLQHVLNQLEAGSTVGGGSTIAADRPIEGAALRTLNFWNRIATSLCLAAGCFVFCRKDAFDQVGGFNTKVYAGEEIYLSRALKKWGRRRSMRFEIATVSPVVTSVRKLDWYNAPQLIRQALIVLIPGAVYSKALCKTWYGGGSRDNHKG